jgi:hypothetical protein
VGSSGNRYFVQQSMSRQTTEAGYLSEAARVRPMTRPVTPVGEQAELRKFTRYSQVLAATLSWTGTNEEPMFSEGLTRDVSAGGAFIHLNQCPPVGTVVHYELFLPAVRRKGPNVRIGGSGQVLRIERLGATRRWHGVAVCFSKQMIRVHRIGNVQ